MLSGNKILLRRSNGLGHTPALSSLELGELGLNTIDGKIFTKTINGSVSSIVSFLNSNDYPYTLNHYYSSVNFIYGNNTVNQVYASVLGGYNNDITGGGSSVINGEDNDIAGDFSLIGSGLKNKINASGDYSFIAAGSGNLINHPNVFTLGTNITSHAPNFTYVNNISSNGYYYGDGRHLTHVGDRYYSTSNTTQTIQKAVLVFQIDPNLSYTPTQDITIAYDINNHMHGTVLDYNTTTGSLTADITTKTGNGTHSSWYVNVGGSPSFLGALLAANNLSDVFDASSALANLSGVSKSEFSSVSSNWQSTYTTVLNNSSSWIGGSGSDVSGLSANWQNTYTTVSSNSSNWNSVYNSVNSLSSDWDLMYTDVTQTSSNWDSSYTAVQSNSANWDTAYAYVSANSVNLTATNIIVTNDLTVSDTVSAKFYQGTLLDWMTLVRGTKTTPTLLTTIATGDVYTYVYSTTGTDKTYYRYIATDGSEDSFYGNFTNPTLSNLIATKKIIL